MPYVYIMANRTRTMYTGITNDLDGRIAAHENGTGAKYTRGRGPFRLVYSESCENRSAASKRERDIKNLSRDEKLQLLQKKSGER